VNLATNLIETVARHGSRPAVKLDAVALSYDRLERASARVAGLLQAKGIVPGDRVGIMLPNVPYFAIAYYGVLRAGGVVVPMNVLLKGREVRYHLEDSGAKVLIGWYGFADTANEGAAAAGIEPTIVEPGMFEQLLAFAAPLTEIAQRSDTDTAVILYTSGTTGTPKGAELTHGNLGRNCEVAQAVFAMTEQDVVFGGLPLFHAFGQTCGLNTVVRAGACSTLLPRFDPAVALQMIERDRVTIFQGVPTTYTAMLNDLAAADTDASTLRICVSGGAALPVEILRGFEERFTCKLLEGYGLSETSPVASFNHPDRDRKAGSIGTPIEGVEMKLVNDDGNAVAHGQVGEIVIRGHNVMKGYWNRPEATAEAIDACGWFHTGDMARVDEDGYFFIIDRKKDMIIRGGYNVYPREIEEVLYEHPAVREAAVIAIPHDELGEEVGAAVVLNDGARANAAGLRGYVKERVAAYKYPRTIWLVAELPKGPTGKILKREIQLPRDSTAGAP
jgi:long-chain acyl-CoA synthetase